MATMNISLTDDLKSFAEQKVSEGAYASTSEYLRELIAHERDKQKLRDLVLEGLHSPASPLSSEEIFDQMHRLALGARR